MLVHCNPLICVVIVEDGSNNCDAFTLRTPEYTNILKTAQNVGKYNTMTQICNLMIVPCNQLVSMVIADDVSNNFDEFTLRTVSVWSII
jgi:hypothetical protein